MISQGDIVFFKKAKKSVKNSYPEVRFKGYGLALFLGALNPFQKEPSVDDIHRALGASGFVSFTNVLELLGKEPGELLLKKFIDKYYSEAESLKELKDPEKPPSNIIGIDGKPLSN